MPYSIDASQLAGCAVLVTGGRGFLGGHIVRQLVEARAEVTVVTRRDGRGGPLGGMPDQVHVVRSDIRSLQIERLPRSQRPRIVLHLASAGTDASAGFDDEGASVNLLGTLQALRVARSWGADRFVHAGSGFEYGSGEYLPETAQLAPVGAYAASKAAGSLAVQAIARQSGFPAVVLRPFTLYGPGEVGALLVSRVTAALLRGEAIQLTSGEQRRDLVYVEDAAEAFLAAGTAAMPPGDTTNVCTGIAVSIRSIAEHIGRSLEREDLLIFGAQQASSRELPCNSGDPRKAGDVLGWCARTSLERGLARTLAWWRATSQADILQSDALPPRTD